MYIGEANCFATFLANKMNVVIVVMALGAIVFTKGVQHRIINGWYGMNNSFFKECLQCTVYGNPVEFFTGLFFNIAMRQRPVAQ